MYTNYNIPQKGCCKPGNLYNSTNYIPNSYTYSTSYPSNYRSSNYETTTYGSNSYYNDGDRFFGGGFLAPFLLGGVGGYLLGRPNYGYQQGPIPVYFPPQVAPYPYPMPYTNTNIYY